MRDEDIKYIHELEERVQELEDIIYKDERQAVLESIYDQNKRYREALEFYADVSIYNFETETDFDAEETRIINKGHIFRDFGEKARQALESDNE